MANVTVDATNVRPLAGCVTREFDMGEAGALGKACQVAGDGALDMANATSAAGVAGLLVLPVAGERHEADGDLASGERVTVVVTGPVYLGEDAALDETKVYYVAETDGILTDIPPTEYRAVGTPVSTTVLFWNPVSTVPAS